MIEILLYIVFVLSAIVLIIVVLLQEGRGGGFGQALGEHGQQTFGVAASGIHKFTLGVAGVFLASAVLIHALGQPDERFGPHNDLTRRSEGRRRSDRQVRSW